MTSRLLPFVLSCGGAMAGAQIRCANCELVTPPASINYPERPDAAQQERNRKADYEKARKETGELIKLAEALKVSLEHNDRQVLSASTLKKLDQIEKTARRIRGRLKRQ